ncbi:PREDICTED: protein misato homolog 1 [Populus euphratica]|uniref:Protein misato homolog 1 n=1 Tax=Populus euphratica TaxID=75702 RepID=A0AAJ6T1C7_POPEU|nr:PREDICTED: protein misato homolog 1 [Populus euphratica]XP_011002491.1 PREDICTED: protein misato homolog 1 [Populus euphratica]
MRELVTVQVGGFANFVGSHFWNFQDELLGLAGDPDSDPVFKNQSQYLNMDTLYRTGETNQGVQTYTPRLLSIDYQGSLGSMSSRGTLYNESSSAPSNVCMWTSNVSTHASEPLKKNLFLQSLYEEELENLRLSQGISNGKNDNPREIQNQDIVDCLESDVQYWTDFSKVHYHPQSLYELNGLWMNNVEFDNYGIGRDIFSGGLRGEEISERLRFFIEECDHIQGFQFIVDDSGGFSAIAADFLESIADEYTNTPVLLYTVRGPGSHMNLTSQKQKLSRSIHDALSFSRLSSFCKLIVPVGLPLLSTSKASMHLCIKDEMPYHSSAVYAAALHSISVPFRIEPLGPANSHNFSGAVDVNGVTQLLAGQARQNMVTILDVSMPAPPISGKHAEHSLLRNLQPLTPEIAQDVEDMQAVEFMTVHGALRSGGHHAFISEVTDSVNAAYENSSSRPKFCHLSVSSCPLPIPLPFPKIFCNLVGQHGELLSSPVPGCSSRGSLDVHSIPVAARLRSSTAVLPFLESRLANLRRLGIQQGAPGTQLVRSWGFGKDELEDMEETLSKMVTKLDDRAQLSDSD